MLRYVMFMVLLIYRISLLTCTFQIRMKVVIYYQIKTRNGNTSKKQ